MPIPKKQYTEQNDNTRVILPRMKEKPIKPKAPLQLRTGRKGNVDSTKRVKYFETKRDMANQYVFGYGLQGRTTKYNPTIPKHQKQIEKQFDGAGQQASQFLGDVFYSALGEGAVQAVKTALKPAWKATGTTSAVIRRGGLPYWIPSKAKKLTTNTRFDIHASNQAPSALPHIIEGTKNGKLVASQRVVKHVSGAEEQKAINQIIQKAIKNGYRKIPEQYGLGLSKGGIAYIDLAGNIGKVRSIFTPWKKEYVWFDPVAVPLDQLPYFKRGGNLLNRN